MSKSRISSRHIGSKAARHAAESEDIIRGPDGKDAERDSRIANRTGNRRNDTEHGSRTRLLRSLPVTERVLDIAGISTAVLEGGEGPPVMLLHGPGESSLWWMRVIPELVATHHVIAPDLPGHGSSGSGDVPLDVDRVMTWLDELVRRVSGSPPTVVGHTLGGAIAARFGIRRPAAFGRLVLVDSLGLAPFRPRAGFAFALIRFLARPTRRTYDRFLPQCMFDTDGLQSGLNGLWEPFIAYNLERAGDAASKRALRTLMKQLGIPRIAPEELARIATPTTLIWGRYDRATRLSVAEAASARYRWPLYVIENAGDDPKLEQPEAFLQALRAAMADRSSPGDTAFGKETSAAAGISAEEDSL